MFTLDSLGWTDFFEQQYPRAARADLIPARVAEEQKNFYRVFTEAGDLLAELAGKLRHSAGAREDLPAVGDWVLVRPRVGEARATIHQLLKRRSKFSRQAAGRGTSEQVIAANVDTAFLVSALNRDFNPRRIERYVALAWESGARPVVLLNKADLVDDPLPLLWEAEAAAPGVAVHLVSAATGAGLDALSRYLALGQTIVLLGSSGVGKSTLINRLAGCDLQRVSAISDSRDRGRHTTTSRQMIPLDAGGLLIDTPGLRELQLWDASAGLGRTFEDIAAFSASCRFRDCTHQSEPDCAVLTAVEAGALGPERLESYRKLERELAFQHRKQDAAARAAEQRRWRAIHKAQRAFYKRP